MDTVVASWGCPATLHIQLSSDAEAARQARQTVTGLPARATASCPGAVVDDLVLIVSELVTNAVVHAQGPYALIVSLEAGRAGIAVSDGSADLPEHQARTGGGRQVASGGRGLEIVQALGADLFVSRSAGGKQVIAVLTW
ncbi:ATP-binding protein [Streptomyces sp. NPDC048606]|uniref:ATP-binding protein n=1 Tax=Streptomyces sp. NPDC048606 TaxID=3154726 RepID=UPI00343781F9